MAEEAPKRMTWSKKGDETVIEITGKIERWQESLMFSWALLWTFCGLAVLTQLFGDYTREQRLFMYVFLAFWAYFEYKAVYAWMWRKWGRELIKVTSESVLVKRDIRTYGKMIRYISANVKNVRVAGKGQRDYSTTYSKSFWVVTGGRVWFDHLGKTITVGVQLEEKEAEKLANLIRQGIRKKA